MSNVIVRPKPEKFFKQIIDRKFEIPDYQRLYNWDEELVAGLFRDIKEHSRKNKDLYLGTLICKKKGDKLVVIDGQQRLITLAIILRRLLKTKISSVYRRKIEAWFKVTPMTKREHFKLNEDERNDFFQDCIWLGRDPNRDEKKNDDLANFIKAFQVVDDWLSGYKTKVSANKLFKFISSRIEFVYVELNTRVADIEIFESINSKRLELSKLDLIKSFLLDDARTGRQKVRKEWDLFINSFKKLKDAELFFKYFCLSFLDKDNFRDNIDIFKIFKTKVYSKIGGNPEEAMKVVASYLNHYEEFTQGKLSRRGKPEIRYYYSLSCLNYLGYKAHLPLLLKLRSRNSIKRIYKTVELMEFYIFTRRMIQEIETQLVKDELNAMLFKFQDNFDVTSINDELNDSLNDYFRSGRHVSDLAEMSSKKESQKYVLYRILNIEPNSSRNIVDYKNNSLEHIFPQGKDNLPDYWVRVKKHDFLTFTRLKNDLKKINTEQKKDAYYYENYIQGLGNMILLNNMTNIEVQDDSFSDKRAKYREKEYESNFIVRHILTYPKWNAEQMTDNSKWLARRYFLNVRHLLRAD